MLDATCTPSDIAYPTGLGLLIDSLEKLEDIIDTFHAPFPGKQQQQCTYYKRARKQYLSLSKQHRSKMNKIRKGNPSTVKLCPL